MACVGRWVVGVFAAWWLGIVPALAAPPERASSRALRVDAFDVEQVAGLAPGTPLRFSVFATPGASATVLVDGVRRLVELREVAPGVYEGVHVIAADDRIGAAGTAVATVWRDGAVVRAALEESLLLDGAPPEAVASAAEVPRPAPLQTPSAGVVAQVVPVPQPWRAAPARVPAPWSLPPSPGQPEVAPAPAGRLAACRDCAVVESIRAVEVPTGPAHAGAIAGGIAGAVFGEQIGKAHERHVTRVLGAIGGALLGREIQRAAGQRTWYDAALRLPDGSLRVRRYDAPPPFRVGQLVSLEAGFAAGAAPSL